MKNILLSPYYHSKFVHMPSALSHALKPIITTHLSPFYTQLSLILQENSPTPKTSQTHPKIYIFFPNFGFLKVLRCSFFTQSRNQGKQYNLFLWFYNFTSSSSWLFFTFRILYPFMARYPCFSSWCL